MALFLLTLLPGLWAAPFKVNDASWEALTSTHREFVILFYADWCGHSQFLLPRYRAASDLLLSLGIPTAEAEANDSERLLRDYDIKGFPSLNLYTEGGMVLYTGERDTESIVTWAEKKVRGMWECGDIEGTVGKKELLLVIVVRDDTFNVARQAAKYAEDAFVMICSEEELQVWEKGREIRAPGVALVRKKGEEVIRYSGEFSVKGIREFLQKSELPLVLPLTERYLSRVFNYGGSLVIFFREEKDKQNDIDVYRLETQGDLSFLFADCSSDLGSQLCKLLRVESEPQPFVRLVISSGGSLHITQYAMKERISRRAVTAFIDSWRQSQLPALVNSQEVPTAQYDGDVRILVASTYPDFLNTRDTDLVVLLYAPWCIYSQRVLPVFDRLATAMVGAGTVKFARMDASSNQVMGLEVRGYPTILIYPARRRETPIKYSGEREFEALKEWVSSNVDLPLSFPSPPREDL